MKSSALGLTGAIMIAQAVVPASAQSLFVRDRNVSVLDRERPDYEAQGIRAGQFVLKPKLDIGTGVTSNVFAISDINDSLGLAAFENRDDFFVFVRPSVRAESDWNRHALALGAYVEGYRFDRFDSETTVDYGAYADGRLELARAVELFGGASYDRLNESRRANNSAFLFEEPVRYDLGRLYAGVQQEVGRILVRARADVADYDFDDVDPIDTGDGLVSDGDQDFRDRTSWGLVGEIAYAVSPALSLFAEAEFNEQDFETTLAARNRDSEGWALRGGADFDLTRMLRGRVGIGYFDQSYDGAFEDIDGVSVDAALEWFPTELTTVTLTAERGVDQSAIVSAGGYVSTDVILRVDHELQRNLILSAFAAWGMDEYEDGIVNSGVPLLDANGNPVVQDVDRFGLGFGGDYYFNRTMSVGADYTFESQDVETDITEGGFDTDFDIHQLLVTLTLQR